MICWVMVLPPHTGRHGGFVAVAVDESTHDGHGIDAMMLVEGIVFRSQEGHGQPGRHLLEGDAVAFSMAKVPMAKPSRARMTVACGAS